MLLYSESQAELSDSMRLCIRTGLSSCLECGVVFVVMPPPRVAIVRAYHFHYDWLQLLHSARSVRSSMAECQVHIDLATSILDPTQTYN